MFPQHPDDIDTGLPMTDHQNAYLISQLTTDRNPDRRELAALEAAGLYGLVKLVTEQCRHTDAILPGETRRLVRDEHGAPRTFHEAENALAALHEILEEDALHGDSDMRLRLIGPGAAEIAAAAEAAQRAAWEADDDWSSPF